jgi:hypothetical protein
MRPNRNSDYSLLIICEGDKTEPTFFASIRDQILLGHYLQKKIAVSIQPEPKAAEPIPEEDSDLRPKRKSRTAFTPEDKIYAIKGAPPLSWVNAGKEALKDGSYNEVWVVFDHDNHPAREEAFGAAEEEINGKKVQIAFSSVAFEYYLLVNFERLYTRFVTSECREGKKPIYCSLHQHEKDCHGLRCIGGYARSKNYWTNSKTSESLFPVIKDRLSTGFLNSHWLRYQSEKEEGTSPVFNRNPYLTSDLLVNRLTNDGEHGYYFSVPDVFISLKQIEIRFSATYSLTITNSSKITLIVPPGFLRRISHTNETLEELGNRQVLKPGESFIFDFQPAEEDQNNREYIFQFEKDQVLYCPLAY